MKGRNRMENGKRIFISYAHDDKNYDELVDRLYDTLTERGFVPWKDDRFENGSGIAAGRRFDEVIQQAIDDSDFFLALISAKSIASDYCSDEREYAINRKGNYYIVLRAERVDIFRKGSRSYVDLTKVYDGMGMFNEACFLKALEPLWAALDDPDAFAREQTAKGRGGFEAHLRVAGCEPYYAVLSKDSGEFVGRKWLEGKCREWVTDSGIEQRLFMIIGEAGTGKTGFVRRISQDRELVRSVHICMYNGSSTRTARNTLLNLSYILTETNGRYAEYLRRCVNLTKIKELEEDALFETLFLEPLRDETEKYLLIIDGLDEMRVSEARTLFSVFQQYSCRINRNISFLATCRPEVELLRLAHYVDERETVTLDEKTNEEDVKEFISMRLKELGISSAEIERRIFESCDGNFEYLTLLFNEAEEGKISLDEDLVLPKGIYSRYTDYLNRRFDGEGVAFDKRIKQFLSMLCASFEPVEVGLFEAADIDEDDAEACADAVGTLVRRLKDHGRGVRYTTYSKAFRDYLMDEDAEYYVGSRRGHSLFAGLVMKRYRSLSKFRVGSYMEKYGFVHLLLHCFYSEGGAENAVEYFKSLFESEWDADGIYSMIAEAMCIGGDKAVEGFFAARDAFDIEAVVSSLEDRRCYDEIKRIGELYLTTDEKGIGYRILGNNCKFWQNGKRADYYKMALEFDKEKVRKNPSYENRRELALDYRAMGRFQDDQQKISYAESALELFFENRDLSPCYEVMQDIAKIYAYITGIYKHTYASEYKKYLELTLQAYEKATEDYPCYDSKHELALFRITYQRYSDDTIFSYYSTDIMEKCYEEVIRLSEEHCREFPSKKNKGLLVNDYIDYAEELNRKNELLSVGHPKIDKIKQLCQKAEELLVSMNEKSPLIKNQLKLLDLYEFLGKINMNSNLEDDWKYAFACYEKALNVIESISDQRVATIELLIRIVNICKNSVALIKKQDLPEYRAFALEYINKAIGLSREEGLELIFEEELTHLRSELT